MYCAAWATVFCARVVCIVGVLFTMLNAVTALTWMSSIFLRTESTGIKFKAWAKRFDSRWEGMPVMQTLIKAFVLPRVLDLDSAALAQELHTESSLKREHAEAEQKLGTLDGELEKQRSKVEALKAKIVKNEDNSKLDERLDHLEKHVRNSIDSGNWHQMGADAVEAAKAKAMDVEQASTEDLERIVNRIRGAADQLQHSQTAQSAMAQAQQGASSAKEFIQSEDVQARIAQVQAQAQQAAAAGASSAKEFIQSEDVQARVAQVQGAATKLADSEQVKTAVSQVKKGTKK